MLKPAPSIRSGRRLFTIGIFLPLPLIFAPTTEAQETDFVSFDLSLLRPNLSFRVNLKPDLTTYYILQDSPDLSEFTSRRMFYGGADDAWNFSISIEASAARFWRVLRIPVISPFDSDGDGLDDVFELSHGLNPLDASDAGLNSGLTDADNHSLTWLEAYHYYFVHNIKIYDAVSREISSFNFGQPTANYEAISREISAFNIPAADSDGDGIDDDYEKNHGLNAFAASDAGLPSSFTDDFPDNTGKPLSWLENYRLNFGANRPLYNSVSREVSVFNFGQPSANSEALSREVSVFNIPPMDSDGDGIDDVYETNHGLNPLDPSDSLRFSEFTDDFPSHRGNALTWLQLYHLNFGANRVLYDAPSREVSVFNFGQATANFEAISREVSVFDFGHPVANYEAISREVSIFNEP